MTIFCFSATCTTFTLTARTGGGVPWEVVFWETVFFIILLWRGSTALVAEDCSGAAVPPGLRRERIGEFSGVMTI